MYSAGGLVTAVAPVVVECDGLWVGWTGLQDYSRKDIIPESSPDDLAPTAGQCLNIQKCSLSNQFQV